MPEGDPTEKLRELLVGIDESLVNDLIDHVSGRAGPRISVESEHRIALPDTDPAIRAALADTFTLEEIGSDESSSERDSILSNANAVMIGRKRRLRLSDESRADLLERVRRSERYQALLDARCEADRHDFEGISSDDVRLPTAWLSAFLKGEFGALEKAPARELRAAVSALERLRLLDLGSNVPSLSTAQRLLELAEVLEPLRLLIGTSGGWEGSPPSDRFVGRDAERRDLRAFVDELESESALESVTRGATRVLGGVVGLVTGVRSKGTFIIQARGGLGKSALIAKFVLDHALSPARRLPFAYLDFDRAALQPREPLQLLGETARQVATQFPEMASDVRAFRQTLWDQVGGKKPTLALADHFQRFREILTGHVTRHSRAFLLVLDTMELVQYDPRALDGVVAFVDGLGANDFPELCVVAAGRADIPELRRGTAFRSEGKVRVLNPLSIPEAKEMASRLGEALLGESWKLQWSERIAGNDKQPDVRREPLGIRVAVELLRAADVTTRDGLSERIARLGEDGDDGFIGPLYQRRVLDHVRVPEARRLAWPGLVVRRVTREIARDLLAEPCGVPRGKADEAFDALGREVWIVDRDGDALRHQPDLRARTLPLMRRHNRELFSRVNTAAIQYFGARQQETTRARAEWIYHRLLSQESPESVDSAWTDDLVPLLAGASEDFESGTEASNYLLARTATRLLPVERISALQPRLALEHLARVAPEIGRFDDHRLASAIVQLPWLDTPDARLSDAAAAAHTTLAVKTGRWKIPLDEIAVQRWSTATVQAGPWQENAAFAVAFRRARTIHPERSDPVIAPPPTRSEPGIEPQPTRSEPGIEPQPTHVNDHRRLAQQLAASRLVQTTQFFAIDAALGALLIRNLVRLRTEDLPILRTVMLFGRQSVRPAARLWLDVRRQSRLEGTQPTISAQEIRALTRGNSALRERVFRWADLVEGRKRMRITEPDAVESIENALEAHLNESDPEDEDVQMMLRRFAAARDEDWIIPIAYAAARVSQGRIPVKVVERLAAADRDQPKVMTDQLSLADPLEVLRRADEGSDLVGVARAFVEDDTARSDLHVLLRHHARWRKGIESAGDTFSVA